MQLADMGTPIRTVEILEPDINAVRGTDALGRPLPGRWGRNCRSVRVW